MNALHSFLGERLDRASEDEIFSFPAVWSAWILAEEQKIDSASLSRLDTAKDELGIAGMNLLAQAHTALGENGKAGRLYERSKNFITMGTQSIGISETYEKAGYFSNGEVELALFLKTADLLDEESELILRIAGALDGKRHSRRFHSSFDDFWIINGFKNLLARNTPDSDGNIQVMLGETTLAEQKTGSNPGQSISEVYQFSEPPLSGLKRGENLDMSFKRADPGGRGSLYYAATLNYAIPVETAMARNEGIELFSQVETLDGQILDEANLPLGVTLRMRVSMSTLSRRSHLNLLVPIPSGAEIVDPSFATSGSFADSGGIESESWNRETVYGDTAEFDEDGYVSVDPWGWDFRFYHPIQTVYDNAVKYSWDDFYSGRREISFLFRTTTPGVYPTPPVSASLEFEPEVFGRTEGRLVIIRGE